MSQPEEFPEEVYPRVNPAQTSPKRPGIRVDDIVQVRETESPWINGPWRGQVVKLWEAGDCRVVPIEEPQGGWRIRVVDQAYIALGLYLTSMDVVTAEAVTS